MKTILYFTATWCNPCKQMKPIAESLDGEYANFEFIDADLNMQMIRDYGVTSVPTLILLDGEEELRRLTGAKNREELINFIEG